MTPSQIHALCIAAGWGYGIDVAILVARHLRGRRLALDYQIIHGIILSLSFMFSTFGIGYIIAYKGLFLFGKTFIRTSHNFIGFVTFIFSILGLYYGYDLKKKIKESNNYNEIMLAKRQMIRYGWLTYILGKLNIFLGCLFYKDGRYLDIFFYCALSLAIIHYIAEHHKRKNLYAYSHVTEAHRESNNPIHKQLVLAINEGKPREEIIQDFPGIKWVLVGNSIYDLTDFTHPGGDFMIKAVIGREVTRFLYGGHALEHVNMKPYTHPAYVFQVMEKYRIGTLDKCEALFLNVNRSLSEARLDDSEGVKLLSGRRTNESESSRSHTWVLVGKEQESQDSEICRYDFACKSFKVKNYCSNIGSFGRHVLLHSAENNSKIRPYSISLSINKENKELRNRLVKYFEECLEQQKALKLNIDENYLAPKEVFSLYIKKYQFGGFSESISKASIGKEFKIYGPYGQGLGITPDMEGSVTILFAGTGIFPFLDFLNYFLLKNMHTVLKKNVGNEAANNIQLFGADLSSQLNHLSVFLIGAFGETNLGWDIIEKLAEISTKYSLNNFHAFVKQRKQVKSNFVDNIGSQRIDLNLLRRIADTQSRYYYVCGTPHFNKEILDTLDQMNIPQNKIILI